uniref:Uncharacterized protein LOC111110817 isoform X2 n=1 Tax=Crassostrea virginica TaxID=6565 RepID=A0A8B8BJX6_CRAVI|nr:uncharacterized protein LOC111110817 isoform X2 [Crassostrea virginica]
MASTSYAASEEMTNINRVSRLLMGPCTDQLRDLLRFYIPSVNFNTVIQTVKSRLPRLTEPQRKLILPTCGVYSGNYDDMDISLLYILLRNVCGIQAHNKGWGNAPDSADRSVSANIERLRLARNRCGHSTRGMSNNEYNQVWSEIRAAVVDLDKTLGIGNKYQEVVDFIRNDTMDPTRDKHFRDLLLEQIKETENIKKDVHGLQSFQQMINERNIPLNIQEQHKILLESWLKGDKLFHEIHSFPDILGKIKLQPITTIIGGPGSGKTSTARHLALRLQNDCEFEIVPVDDITEIKQYGHPKCKLVFILDDVIGVFGVEFEKLTNLERYRESILNALDERSKILFTCRKAVYNEAANLKSFVLDKKCLVDLGDSYNQLNAEDRKQILNNYCKPNDISIKPDELSNVSSTVGCVMYPLLCKLFCSKSEYQALGKEFFENPYVCIRKEMDYLQGHKKIQYASLIMCMFCQNEITVTMITKKDPRFMEIREKVFENCRVSGRNLDIKDALDHMINTFTIRTDNKYSLIHDSVFEVLAFHYGNQHPEDMLEYMSSNFVAKKFSISDTSEDHIKIQTENYSAFAKRLVRDLESLDLHDVFMNKTLKIKCICSAFIDELKKMSYHEIKNIFFQEKETSSKMLKRNESWEKSRSDFIRVEWIRQDLLFSNNWEKSHFRAINWVIAYGHSQLLQFLFDQVTKHGESIRRVLGWEVQEGTENSYMDNLTEQVRLLILSCYSGDIEVVKLLLKHGDFKRVLGDLNFSDYIYTRYPDNPTPLTAASHAGHVDIVDLLIKSGADCNKSGNPGDTPICYASGAGHVDIVDMLIKNGADCNKGDTKGQNPLCFASLAGHVDIVDMLIKNGADCNKIDGYGATPLCYASGAGHVDIVDMLIKCGADCNKVFKFSDTPLCEASKAGHVDVVDMLIKSGADCNKSGKNETPPLCKASRHGHVDIVDMLIKSGADCNKSGKYGATPLSEASRAGHVDVVDLLIKSGADCNIIYVEGANPLGKASGAGHVDIVDMLFKFGADCNEVRKVFDTPLCEASKAGHVDIVDLLIKGGADCNNCGKYGATPLCEASCAGHIDIVEMLIKSGADCNKRALNGINPLSYASLAGHVDIVDLLITSGADCNESHRYSVTPLCEASGAGHVDIVEMLIKGGADCNKSGENGDTPLCKASHAGHVDIVEMLIKSGADCNKSGENGDTPLCKASHAGHVDIVDLLIKSAADCNKSGKYGTTPLYEASRAGDIDIVYLLIKGGADWLK